MLEKLIRNLNTGSSKSNQDWEDGAAGIQLPPTSSSSGMDDQENQDDQDDMDDHERRN